MNCRPVRVLGRAASGLILTVAACLVATGSAWAHVTPQPPSFPKGASDVILGFAVPNEATNGSSTVKVEIILPTSKPMTGIHADAMAGWTSSVETTKLAKPITTDDGQISEVASTVTWTATGPGILPDEYATFSMLAGTLPSNASSLTFKAIQTYSDGTVVSWIEPIVKGTPAPEHPTPVIKLTGTSKKS
jgi:periplasmic copper chaperone A